MAFLMMITLTLVSGTSLAAAMCHHQNAQEHAAALHGNDAAAAAALAEEAAGSVASKRGALVDAGAFSLPAFIIPEASASLPFAPAEPAPPRPMNAAKVASLSIPPLLEPPAA